MKPLRSLKKRKLLKIDPSLRKGLSTSGREKLTISMNNRDSVALRTGGWPSKWYLVSFSEETITERTLPFETVHWKVDLEDGRFLVCGSAKGTEPWQKNLFIWEVDGDDLRQIVTDFESMGTVESVRYGEQVYLCFHAKFIHSPEGEVIGVDTRQNFLFYRDRLDPPVPVSKMEEGILSNVKSSDPRFVFETQEGTRHGSYIYLQQYRIEGGERHLEKSVKVTSPRGFSEFYTPLLLIGTDRNGDGLVVGERKVDSPPDRIISDKYQKYHATREEAQKTYPLYETALWHVDRHTGDLTLLGLMPGRGDYTSPIFLLSPDELLFFLVIDGFAPRRTTVIHQWSLENGLRALGTLNGSVLPVGVARDGDRLVCTDAKTFYEIQLPVED